jgi:spoIIIJ-associated protein
MRSVEAEGATIDEAIANALGLLRADRSSVEIEIIESSSKGLLGFGGKPARVRAVIRRPIVLAGEEAPVSQETAGGEPGDGIEEARSALAEIVRRLGLEASIELTRDADGPTFRVEGDGAGLMIGRHGQTLDAIEYLIGRIASHRSGVPTRIAVDVEGYRGRRQESLEQMAHRAAEKARSSGRAVTLSPMSPRDRRIIHVALGEERGVSTRSEGDGPFRHVIVVPAD